MRIIFVAKIFDTSIDNGCIMKKIRLLVHREIRRNKRRYWSHGYCLMFQGIITVTLFAGWEICSGRDIVWQGSMMGNTVIESAHWRENQQKSYFHRKKLVQRGTEFENAQVIFHMLTFWNLEYLHKRVWEYYRNLLRESICRIV